MDSTHIDADTTKSAMMLVGALLVFTSTSWNIVSNKLDKAKTNAAKHRVLCTMLSASVIFLQILGFILFAAAGLKLVFMALFAVSVLAETVLYMIRPEPLPRSATVILVAYWAGLSFCASFLLK